MHPTPVPCATGVPQSCQTICEMVLAHSPIEITAGCSEPYPRDVAPIAEAEPRRTVDVGGTAGAGAAGAGPTSTAGSFATTTSFWISWNPSAVIT